MRSAWHGVLLCSVGVGVWAALTLSGQQGVSAAPSDHVKGERFDVVASIRGLPLGVRDKLQELFDTQTLDMTEPNAEFPGKDAAASEQRPFRRLVAAGCAIDHCFVHYERRGSGRTWPVVLFHWTPAGTRVEWSGHAHGRLATLNDVRNAVFGAQLKGPVTSW